MHLICTVQIFHWYFSRFLFYLRNSAYLLKDRYNGKKSERSIWRLTIIITAQSQNSEEVASWKEHSNIHVANNHFKLLIYNTWRTYWKQERCPVSLIRNTTHWRNLQHKFNSYRPHDFNKISFIILNITDNRNERKYLSTSKYNIPRNLKSCIYQLYMVAMYKVWQNSSVNSLTNSTYYLFISK